MLEKEQDAQKSTSRQLTESGAAWLQEREAILAETAAAKAELVVLQASRAGIDVGTTVAGTDTLPSDLAIGEVSVATLQSKLSEFSTELKEWRLKAKESEDALKVS